MDFKKVILLSVFTNFIVPQELIINESMSKNTSAVLDEDGFSPDWIEIYNNHDGPLNMGNYYLSDDITIFTSESSRL